MGRTGFLTHESFLLHDTGPRHPECADRLRAILHKVHNSGAIKDLAIPDVEPVPIAAAERCHGSAVIDAALAGFGEAGPHFLDGDTVVCPETQEAACRAVGAGRQAADLIAAGELTNAFCAVRPPGHHATPLRSMGFCIFNNVALLARYLQDAHNAQRILIIDWDVHHGNGTQDIFFDDPTVLYFSVHQHPLYPGTGAASDRGTGAGTGATLNVPLPAGAGDAEYADIFARLLDPAAAAFEPEWVLISAGFDAHAADPLGGMALSAGGFGALTDAATAIAHEHAADRCISYLEGGYDLDGLADSVVVHVERLQAAAA